MKAADLKLSELVDFEEGRLNLHGRRLVLHDLHAFAQLRKDLIETVGADGARSVLTRFGYFWGQADAAAMKRIFEWDSLSDLVLAGPRMHTIQGVVKASVRSLDIDESTGRFRMELTWHGSGDAEEHVIEMGRSDAPVCWMMVGYASGYASFCVNREVYFVERTCAGSMSQSYLRRAKPAYASAIPGFGGVYPVSPTSTAALRRAVMAGASGKSVSATNSGSTSAG